MLSLLEISTDLFTDANEDLKKTPWFVILFIALVSIPFFYVFVRMAFTSIKESFGFGTFTSYFKPTDKNKQLAFKVLAAHMIQMDRDQDIEQYRFLVSYIRRRFPNAKKNDFEDLRKLHELFYDYEKVLLWVKINLNDQEKTNMLDLLVDLAFFNGRVNKRELYLLHSVGNKIGLSNDELKSILNIRYERIRKQQERKEERRTSVFQSSTHQQRVSAKVLGLTYSSKLSFDEVRKAYRKLTKKYHPDLFSKGTTDELEMANERFAEINNAYDYLKGILPN